MRFAGVFGDRLALELQRLRIAGHGLGREVVVGPAVGAPAEDLPDEQAAARLEHADIARGIGMPPGADERLVAEPAGVIHRQPVIGAGHVVGVGQVDRSGRRRAPACRPACPTFRVWQATQLRSRIGLMSRIIFDVLDRLLDSAGRSDPRCPTSCRTDRSSWWSTAACCSVRSKTW